MNLIRILKEKRENNEEAILRADGNFWYLCKDMIWKHMNMRLNKYSANNCKQTYYKTLNNRENKII